MQVNHAAVLETSAHRLFPGLSLDQVLARLLLERAQRNLIKYQTLEREFKVKYQQDFLTFRQAILESEPAFDVEQDYFDWELAVTGISDMTQEIQQLRALMGTDERQ
jgi:hypothetical protein